MRRIALAFILALFGAIVPDAARAQSLGGDASGLRRALAVDPFAVAPYRLLTTNLRAADRKKLVDEVAHGGKFADHVVAARLEIDVGQTAPARLHLAAAASQLPSESRALDAFCQLALSAGAYTEAAAAGQRALERGRLPQRLVTLAIAELRRGRRKEGLDLLAEARGKDPTGGATEAALDALLGQRMIAEGAELLRAQLEPHNGNAATGSAAQWRRLADLERQLGKTQAAGEALLHALDVETSSTGRRAVGQSILRLYRERNALPELVHALKDARTSARLTLRGDLELEQKKTSQALASYEAAAKLDPADPDPPLRLATLAKTPAERASRYATLVAAHPGELRYALELADLRFAAKDEVGGKRALAEAAARLSSAPGAQDQLARRMAEHGDLEGALQARRRAAELDPRNPDYAIALGETYRALGKRPEAVAAFADSITRSGNALSAWERAIDALERAGYDDEAGARYVEARKRWPAELGLARRQAAALERRKDGRGALAVWKDIAKNATGAFEREQAEYNARRLDMLVMAGTLK